MRYVLTICVFILFFSCVKVSEFKVPEEVKTTFKLKYPNENDPDWHMDSNGNYESHFKSKGVHYRADFSPNGEWIETETNISKKQLPKAIKLRLESDYFLQEISEIEKVNHVTKGLFYDVEFKRKGKNKDVEFNADGEILKQ